MSDLTRREAALALRQRAEAKASELPGVSLESLSVDGVAAVVHELQVHQIELEMQNEELRGAQLAIERLRARYFELYGQAPVGYLLLDERWTILEANQLAGELLRTPVSELAGKPLARFIAREDQDAFYLYSRDLFKTGESRTTELRVRPRGAEEFWARMDASVTPDLVTGEPRCLTTISDLTTSRSHSARLAQADRMASMGLLAAGVAHEINNPLTYVSHYVETLRDDLAALCASGADRIGQAELESLRRRAEDATVGVGRIGEITQGLGGFARADRGKLVRVDLVEVLKGVLRMMRKEIALRATLVTDLAALPPILATRGRLAQVFLNLLLNAVQAIDQGHPEDNRVTVKTWLDGTHVVAAVRDTGSGIPQDLRSSIFDPFFTTKGPERGTGLGLAITREIVAELGGDISLESEVGIGTCFELRFPVATGSARPSPAPRQEPSPVRGRILVVDDEDKVRHVLARILSGEHDVVTVGSAAEAMAYLANDRRFDVVLCDLMMPGVSGMDLFVWLSEHIPHLGPRMAFITGGVFAPEIEAFLEQHPGLPVIKKPFQTRPLRALVAQLVARV